MRRTDRPRAAYYSPGSSGSAPFKRRAKKDEDKTSKYSNGEHRKLTSAEEISMLGGES